MNDESDVKDKDSWYTDIPKDLLELPGKHLLESERIHRVMSSMQVQAQAQLGSKPLIEIDSDRAKQLLGYSPNRVEGTRLYLVRSVVMSISNGYWIHTFKDYLFIHHASLAQTTPPMFKQALILQLEKEPIHVFVTCSYAK